jgi:hypothetical protein
MKKFSENEGNLPSTTSSVLSSSSSSSLSSFNSNTFESSLVFFKNWHNWSQSACSILIGSNIRIISSILTATMISKLTITSFNRSPFSNISIIFQNIENERDFRSMIDLTLSQLFQLNLSSHTLMNSNEVMLHFFIFLFIFIFVLFFF